MAYPTFGPWTSVSQGQSTPGGAVTVVPWNSRFPFAVFVSDPNGGIFMAAGDPQAGFGPWASVSDGRSTPGAPLTVVPWNSAFPFAIFLADPNGGIYMAAGDPQAGFGPWASVGVPPGQSTPGAPLTVVPWTSGFPFAIFLSDNNGGVIMAAGDPQAGFGPWAGVGVPQGQSMPGAPVTVLPWTSGFLFAIFLSDINGGSVMAAGDPQAGFGSWASVSSGQSAPGAPLAVLPWNSASPFAIFLADPNGGIYMAAGDPQAGFGPWASVSQGQSTPGAPLTVVPWGSEFAIFLADPSGGIYMAVGDPQAGFGPWVSVSDGRSTPGAPVTVVPWGSQLAVFVADPNGGVYVTSSRPALKQVQITFDTHDDNKNATTFVSVFVKNRLSTSLSPEQNSSFISNWLAYQRYGTTGDLNDGDQNPYLAYGIGLGFDHEFQDPSSHTFPLVLRSDTISVDEIVLPVVNIHILSDDNDRWIFDYTVTLTFDNTTAFSFSSKVDGIPGIILDQDNWNYSGIGIENPLAVLPLTTKPITNATLKQVTLEFATHNDNKDADTRLDVHIVNRLSATSDQDIAIGLDLFSGEEFLDSGPLTYKRFTWSSDEGSLASSSIRLADMVLPVVYIHITPNGDDRWEFDYRVTFEFGNPQDFGQKWSIYSSRTSGIILDQDNNKHMGVYQGQPFPTVTPPTAPMLTYRPIDHTTNKKVIPISFLSQKVGEFINNRNGSNTSHNPPLRRIRLTNTGDFGDPLPESYADTRSIVAGKEPVTVDYVSNPNSLGQMYKLEVGDTFLERINSGSLNLNIDPASATPLSFSIDFLPFDPTDGSGLIDVKGTGPIQVLNFSITLNLTLDLSRTVNQFGRPQTVVDLMSWVTELNNMNVTLDHTLNGIPFYRYKGTFLHQPVDLVSLDNSVFIEQVVKVDLFTDSVLTDTIRAIIRDRILSKLVSPDVFTKTTPHDGINSMVTSWLLGGMADDQRHTDDNNAVIHEIGTKNAGSGAGIVEDSLVISYMGPRNVFVTDPPADWPTPGHPNAAHDFSPGTLANIDHIVVLTMENRSFDHMLGYLSLPRAQGGMGRHDVDGLKGGEVNGYKGKAYPSFPLTETRFAPDPPHGYEPVHQAINGSQMDGFVKSYGDAHGDAVAGNIMGYHTGANVPKYDALARDFAIGHRWFASHPGPTFCNRFYELTGRLNLDTRGFWEFDNSSPARPVFTPTIFDYLSEQKVTWRYFEHGYCFLRFFQSHTFDNQNVVAADDPKVGFFASARTGQLPSVSFIDPHYIEFPPDANCDGPPADVKDGQAFVSRVVEAVVSSPAWNKTLLLIVYDEHGGFYDHVPPRPAARVSDDLPIHTTGVRVPAFVISPWVAAGSVFGHDGNISQPGGSIGRMSISGQPSGGQDVGLHFDHTSILKTIARRFMSENPPYLGARYAAANDLSSVLGTQLRKPQFLPFIRYKLQFVSSQMMLNVDDVSAARGTTLHQEIVNDDSKIQQDFSFEDAGNGFVYIRSHAGNLYVTVNVPPPVVATGDAVAASPPDLELILDDKYSASVHLGVSGPRPERQRWKLSPASVTTLDRNHYLISSQAYPGLVLHPVVRGESGSLVVLGRGSRTLGIHGAQDAWKVTSPLLSDEPHVLTAV